MTTVLVDGNKFIDCLAILAYKGTPMLRVITDPLRVELETPQSASQVVRVDSDGACPSDRLRVVATPRSHAIFWDEHALTIATELAAGTIHLALDLRPLGIKIYDDYHGLHIGQNVFSGNVVTGAAAVINLGD